MQTLSVSMMGGTLTRNAKWKLACGDLASGVWFGDQQVEQSPWRQLWGYSSIGCGQWRHMPNWKRTLLPPGTTTPSGPSASPSIPFAMVQKLIVGKRSVENIKTRGKLTELPQWNSGSQDNWRSCEGTLLCIMEGLLATGGYTEMVCMFPKFDHLVCCY